MNVLPKVTVKINKEPLSADEVSYLTEARVQQRLSLPTACELTFFNLEVPCAPGDPLEIQLQKSSLFIGNVTALQYGYDPSGARTMRIRGYDALDQLRRRQPVRSHVDVTLSKLASDLLTDFRILVEPHADGPTYEHIMQAYQSDFDLLQEVAQNAGLYFNLYDNKALQIMSLKGIGIKPKVLSLGKTLHEARFEVNSNTTCERVRVEGWDVLLNAKREGQTNEVRPSGKLITDVPSGTSTRDTYERFLTNEALESNAQADGLAQAELDARASREVTVWGVAEGDAFLKPGKPIQVAQVNPSLEGVYVLTSVTHTLDEKGFLTEFTSLPPAPPKRPQGCRVTLGQVTRIKDKQGMGRVRVKLPTYNFLETGWMGVVCPAAGSKKGVIALPEVGDQVVVLLHQGDPTQGIVLGGLYNEEVKPPDDGLEGSVRKRFMFTTSVGRKVILDEAGAAIRIKNNEDSFVELLPEGVKIHHDNGSYLELLSNLVKLHAKTKLEIEAPGNSVFIRGSRIDFQKA